MIPERKKIKIMNPPINPTFCLGAGGGTFYTVSQRGKTQVEYGGLAAIRKKRLEFREVKVAGIWEIGYYKRRTHVEKVSRKLHGDALSFCLNTKQCA